MIDADPTPSSPTDNASRPLAYTPTSWRAIEWNCHAPTTVVADINGEQVVICECTGNGQHSRDAIPVARFIAGSPGVLQALLDLLRETEGGAKPCAGVWIGNAITAIAKATGAPT